MTIASPHFLDMCLLISIIEFITTMLGITNKNPVTEYEQKYFERMNAILNA